jgi:hypothetical protein
MNKSEFLTKIESQLQKIDLKEKTPWIISDYTIKALEKNKSIPKGTTLEQLLENPDLYDTEKSITHFQRKMETNSSPENGFSLTFLLMKIAIFENKKEMITFIERNKKAFLYMELTSPKEKEDEMLPQKYSILKQLLDAIPTATIIKYIQNWESILINQMHYSSIVAEGIGERGSVDILNRFMKIVTKKVQKKEELKISLLQWACDMDYIYP